MDREPQYYVAQGEKVQGPFARSKLLEWIEAGKVREDMLFSLEGGDWVAGHDCPELFALDASAAMSAARPPAMPAGAAPGADEAPLSRGGGRGRRRRARSRRPAARPRAAPSRGGYDDDDEGGYQRARPMGAPGSVLTVAILDFIGAVAYGIFGVMFIMLVSASKRLSDGTGGSAGLHNAFLMVGILFLVFAAASLVLGLAIKSGSGVARVIQIILSALAVLGGLFGLTKGAITISTLLTLGINIMIIVLLLSGSANEFFANAGGGGRRGGRAGGRGGGRAKARPRRRRRRRR